MILPVVLSGGSGTRLWSVSRETSPKPFMVLPDGLTLLQKTLLWVSEIPDVQEVLTITNRELFFQTKDQYAACNAAAVIRRSFVLEPIGRNTGPAVIMAALYALQKYGPETVVCVFAADHVLSSEDSFLEDVAKAAELARTGRLVVLGVPPSRPETGYGYIELGSALGQDGTFDVCRFVEKPPLDQARKFMDAGNFLWNCGIFVFRAGELENEIVRCAPQLVESASKCWQASQRSSKDPDSVELDRELFRACTSISFDYAVLEKSGQRCRRFRMFRMERRRLLGRCQRPSPP